MASESDHLFPGEYFIEKLLDKRKMGRKAQYLVRWQGWPSSAHSWMSEEDLPVWVVKKFETRLKKRANDLNFKVRKVYCRYQKKPPTLNPVKKIKQRKCIKIRKEPDMPILEREILEWEKFCHRKRNTGGTNCTKPKQLHIDIKYIPGDNTRTTGNSRGIRNLSTKSILTKPLSLKGESHLIEELEQWHFEDEIEENEPQSLQLITVSDTEIYNLEAGELVKNIQSQEVTQDVEISLRTDEDSRDLDDINSTKVPNSGICNLEAGELEQNVQSQEVPQNVEIIFPTCEDSLDFEDLIFNLEPDEPTTPEFMDEISIQCEDLVIDGMAEVIKKSENSNRNVIQISDEQPKVVLNDISVNESTHDLVEEINFKKDQETTTTAQLPKIEFEFIDLTMDDMESVTVKLEVLQIHGIKTPELQSEFVEKAVTIIEDNDDLKEEINLIKDTNRKIVTQCTEESFIEFIDIKINEITEMLSNLQIKDIDDMHETNVLADMGYSSSSFPSYVDPESVGLINGGHIFFYEDKPFNCFEDSNVSSVSKEALSFDRNQKYGIECNIGEDIQYLLSSPLENDYSRNLPVTTMGNDRVETNSSMLSMEPCCSSSIAPTACSSVETESLGSNNQTQLIDFDGSLVTVDMPILEDLQNLKLDSIMGIIRPPNQELLVMCSFHDNKPPGLVHYSRVGLYFGDHINKYLEKFLKNKNIKIEYKFKPCEMNKLNPNDDSDIEELNSGNVTTESETSDEEN